MARIKALDIGEAEGRTRAQLDNIEKSLGRVPNVLATLAQSPAALDAYLGMSKALGSGSLGAALREQIALTVAGINHCTYCASAHAALGKRAGLDDEAVQAGLRGDSTDPKAAAALRFAGQVVDKKGRVSDEDLAAVRQAGYGDGEVTEIIAVVALNLFTNYFNQVATTENDFPAVALAESACACSG